MSDDGLHVVLGAGGALGSALVGELSRRGRRVRGVGRREAGESPEGVEWRVRDVSRPLQSEEACEGASVVYHCVNVPYAEWPTRFPSLTASIVEGTGRAGAKLVYADNTYMYGPVRGAITEEHPYHAEGRLGVTRARAAEDVMEAHAAGVVPVAIGRAPDLYGPGVVSGALGDEVFGRALAGTSIKVPGGLDVPHTYAFVEDVAWALATLGERDDASGSVWHVPAAPTGTTGDLIEALFEVLGERRAVKRALPAAVSTLALVNRAARDRKELLSRFSQPFELDHGRFEAAFGTRVTPHREAVERTVEWYRARRP